MSFDVTFGIDFPIDFVNLCESNVFAERLINGGYIEPQSIRAQLNAVREAACQVINEVTSSGQVTRTTEASSAEIKRADIGFIGSLDPVNYMLEVMTSNDRSWRFT